MTLKTIKRITGDLGEEIAALWLIKKDFKIVVRNFRLKIGELDIVAKKDGVVHFVEVKSVRGSLDQKTSNDEYEAEDNVHPWKLRRLHRTIEIFLERYNLEEADWQLDVAVVTIDDGRQEGRVRMIEDVG